MVKRSRKFCEDQMICKEDRGKGTYTCLAHLAEGRALQCPYTESEIAVVNKEGNYSFKIPKEHGGVCTDFEITPKVKKDLLKKIESISKS